MVDRICVVLEALSVVICLHHLYGKKFRFDIVTVSFLTIEMITMQAIDYFGWPSELSMLFYPVIAVYCVIEFGYDVRKLIINNILNAVIISLLQVILMTTLYIFDRENTIIGLRLLLSNAFILLIVIFVLPQIRIERLENQIKDKEIILTIALVVSIIITIFCLISFKKINFLNHTDWFQNILFSVSVIAMSLLTISLAKSKIKSKEVETELKVHKFYANSFDSLLDNIRAKQHEFDNYINTIYSQHYIYNTYEKLVEAQQNYCQVVISENRFNKLLTAGNRVIIGFLYGKFIEIEKLGVDISYHISIQEMKIGIPVYKIIEIIGNLISNAVEALNQSEKYNKLYVLMVEENEIFNIEIRNENDYIKYSEIELFFTKGYSKKGENRGLGLYHVKTICEEYKLNLTCQNVELDGENWIEFAITNKKETK